MKNKRMKYIENTKQSESGKYNHDGDCQTYSLAYLLDKDYDEVYKRLERLANNSGNRISEWYPIEMILCRHHYTYHCFPNAGRSKKLTIGQLAKLLKDTNIKVAVHTQDHLTVIDNGNIVDKWDCSKCYVHQIHFTRTNTDCIKQLLNCDILESPKSMQI